MGPGSSSRYGHFCVVLDRCYYRCYCGISKGVDQRGHGSAADTLSRTRRQVVDGYFYIISRERCDDGLVGSDEGALGVGWAMMEFTTVAVGRSTMRGQARRAETSDASTVPTNIYVHLLTGNLDSS